MNRQSGLALLLAWLTFAPQAPKTARIQTKEVEYREGGTVLKGFIAWDDAVAGKRPGVLVVHEWWGLNDHARNQARRLAEAGYVGFALDMYGAGKVTMARSGADLAAVVSFHGSLGTKTPAEPGKVKARVLVLAGGADPFVPPEQVEAFRKEMQAAGARFEVVTYPGAKHGFTNPDAGTYGMPQLAYDAAADRQSWAAMLRLFREALGS
ncbi:MAG: dienelactone hydrolase [Gemmatimonadetes bacterium]|nr:MAG: dienelactone hydrolase [Gemmatimonadota bacterium]